MKHARAFRLRDFTDADLEAVRLLNNSEIPHVSQLSPAELQHLAGQAFYFRVVISPTDEIVGFLLALNENAVYESMNFQWFKSRYDRFVYVDRVVVCTSAQGNGVGRLIYSDLCARAALAANILTCEVNLRPENPKSLGFHQALGFDQVGTQDTEGGKKTVSLMALNLP